ncbi:hypothetical protein TNIN_81971 [Trichonephila inaurata madagascariensis]|uniref:Uncharacterized protein n=1 Tax=Trichonephila inaurata madagascariensis TaxID=2747483 RepID=A0A8X6MBG5_9ARAC|nr:hypothetical protein TNIN_81971 [Trichonephila inaurata madagascariensis]
MEVSRLKMEHDLCSAFTSSEASSKMDSALGQLEVSSLSQGGPCHHNIQSGNHLRSIPRDAISAGFSLEGPCLPMPLLVKLS